MSINVLKCFGKTALFNDIDSGDTEPVNLKEKVIKNVEDVFTSSNYIFIVKVNKGKKKILIYPGEVAFDIPSNCTKYACGDDYNAYIDENGVLVYSFYDYKTKEIVNERNTSHHTFVVNAVKRYITDRKMDDFYTLAANLQSGHISPILKMLKEKEINIEFEELNAIYANACILKYQYNEYMRRSPGYKTQFKMPIITGNIFGLSGEVKNFDIFITMAKFIISVCVEKFFQTTPVEGDDSRQIAQNEIRIIEEEEDEEEAEEEEEEELEDNDEISSFINGSNGLVVKLEHDEFKLEEKTLQRLDSLINDLKKISTVLYELDKNEELVKALEMNKHDDEIEEVDETDVYVDLVSFDDCFFAITDKGKTRVFSIFNMHKYFRH